MSILFSEEKSWLVNNWISRSFFEDCLLHLEEIHLLKEEIRFCVEAEVDTLNLRNKDFEALKELRSLVKAVIQDNLQANGKNFQIAEYFPLYLNKVKELNSLIQAQLDALIIKDK